MNTIRIIDLHNHSLPQVDDGAKSIDEAVENIKYLNSLGIYDIVLTSHYIIDSEYDKNVRERESILKTLKSKLNDNSTNLYLGNEVFITDANTIKSLLKSGEITTINGSRYMLVEFPLRQSLSILENVICELNELGITPIIAHPERYSYIQNNFDKIYNLLDYDCLLQCNILSFVGHYGPKAKKTLKRLLKEDLVAFLATDFHHIQRKDEFSKAIKRLNKNMSIEKFKKLTFDNPLSVLKDEIIEND